jgi:hypothetical protein
MVFLVQVLGQYPVIVLFRVLDYNLPCFDVVCFFLAACWISVSSWTTLRIADVRCLAAGHLAWVLAYWVTGKLAYDYLVSLEDLFWRK